MYSHVIMGSTLSFDVTTPNSTVPFTKSHDIIDFKESNGCMQYKYSTLAGQYLNITPTTDEDISTMIFHQCERSKSPCFIQDNVKIPILNDTTTYVLDRVQIGRGFEGGWHDGLYDIWLRDCKNLTELSIDIEGVGTVYSRKFDSHEMNKDFQIPLWCESLGPDIIVDKFMYVKHNNNIHVSCIPIYVFIHNKVTFTVNDGAEAIITGSTVHLPIDYDHEICRNKVYFKIDDVQYFFQKMKPTSCYCFTRPDPNIKHFQVQKVQ